ALPAPKIAGLLPAPKIAGLLPARVGAAARPAQPNIEIIIPVPRSIEELFAQIGPIRSREAMNAELVALVQPHPQPLSKVERGEGSAELSLAHFPSPGRRGAKGEVQL